eukprot:CAMPEP_0180662460 /NCGR_PEP_ID=MMETSP1037_2-20121125/59405_1 /TAXON_ID=632150 /ORGANISM="Azadinium spinosum, Strain 3D9" /LENGTH=74 /DNA_ID=CAMNT_0022690127 /DNA_START=8 /DNA_END=228 /DNA_ORIENTATION=+
MVLLFFTFELAVRLQRHGRNFWLFFTTEDWAWNWLDLFIVVFGMFDQWVLPFWMTVVGKRGGPELGDMFLLIRT